MIMKPEEIDSIARIYAKVDMDAIKNNVLNMAATLKPGTKIVGVIKTDGYGHGSVPIGRMLEKMDIVWGYAVATAEEAVKLRENDIDKPILILGYTFPYANEYIISHGIRPAVFREDTLKQLDETAAKLGITAPVHIKVDTGMSRIGIRPDDTGMDFVKAALACKNLKVEGILTHFARADEADKTEALEQFDRFVSFVSGIKEETGYEIPLVHCSNSAGIVELPQVNLDLVRAGITLYGMAPSDEVDMNRIRLYPAMELKSHIVYIKKLKAGSRVSYGGTYTAAGDMLLATIPVGYGDGYPRSLSNRGEVIIRGKRAPICGRVCMDQMMVDVTDIPDAAMGDAVTLVGRDGGEYISMEEIGEKSGRFNYEFACDISPRVPRVYISDNEVTEIVLEGKRI